MTEVYSVTVAPGIQYDCGADESLLLKEGDEVIIQHEKYQDYGIITRCFKDDGSKRENDTAEPEEESESGNARNNGSGKPGVNSIVRAMTLQDKAKAHENDARANSMFRTAQRKVQEHLLQMKLLNCHYAFDKSVVIFQFAAESRVDFRELVRDLSGALHCRVELRQIGVRDEAAMEGGMGLCGRPYCCATVLKHFSSVNVKMAKIQRLSLNPSSVSGGCGRLKCCLRFEVDGYREMFANMPRTGAMCETPEGPGRVLDCNALTQVVRVRLDGDGNRIADFAMDDIQDKGRSGKNRR